MTARRIGSSGRDAVTTAHRRPCSRARGIERERPLGLLPGRSLGRSLGLTPGLALGLAIVLTLACSGGDAPPARGPATVKVEVAKRQALADRREYVGTVRSVDQIEIRARVRGYLLEQRFTDGARVEKGALLFRIDPRPFEVALAEAKGQLARATADAVRAARDLERAEALHTSGVLSPGLLDERRATRDASAAAVEAASANVRAAELDLSYAQIRAPIAGRMGRGLVDVGNLVGESGQDTILAELVVEDPVRVYFAAPEGEAIPRSGASEIPVAIELGDGTRHPHPGLVDYVDPSIDAERGTLSLRARVPNPEGSLRPGQFVRVLAEFPDAPTVVSVPQRAVFDEQGGSYVLIVDGEEKVERRPVQPGRMVEGRQEILAGLDGGERVIVDGVQGVRPGDAVAVEAGVQVPVSGTREATPAASVVDGTESGTTSESEAAKPAAANGGAAAEEAGASRDAKAAG